MWVGNKKLYKKNSPIGYNKAVLGLLQKNGEMYGKPNKQSGTYQVGEQVSHRVTKLSVREYEDPFKGGK